MELRDKLSKLIDERNSIWFDQMKPLVEQDEMTSEEAETYNRCEERVSELDNEIEQTRQALDTEQRVQSQRQLAAEYSGAGAPSGGDGPASPVGDEERYREAFTRWMQRGMSRLDTEDREILSSGYVSEQRQQATEPGTAGGYLVPQDFRNRLIEAMSAFGGVRRAGITQITTDTGQDIVVPTNDDTGNTGRRLGENQPVQQQDVTVGQKTVRAYTYTSDEVKASLQLMTDSAVDLEGFLRGALARRIGRAQAPEFITGTGTDQPEGIVTGTTVGHTAANTASLVYEDFIHLEHSVDAAYRNGGEYLLSDDALKQGRLITDANGLPIWRPGMVGGDPDTINGYRFTVDQEMANVATTEKPIVFGDLSFFWVRDVSDVRMIRLDERHAENLQVAFLGFVRSDSRKVTAGDDPFKVLQMA